MNSFHQFDCALDIKGVEKIDLKFPVRHLKACTTSVKCICPFFAPTENQFIGHNFVNIVNFKTNDVDLS